MILLSACLMLAACSNTPRAAGPATNVATTASTSHAPTSDGQPVATQSDVDPALIKAGYRVMRRKDQVLYCRSEIITGQRIATQVCLTAAQIQTEKQNVTKAKDLMGQGGMRCLKPQCD